MGGVNHSGTKVPINGYLCRINAARPMSRTKNFDELQVLDKAVALFRRQGYQATSPADLVAVLGISRSSLYSTYGDKRALFIKALQRYRAATTAALLAIAGQAKDVKTLIKEIFDLTMNGCLEETMPKGCFLVNSVAELPQQETELFAIVNESRADHRQVFVQLLQKGQQSGQLTTALEPEALADYMVNCLSGISITAKGGASRETCENIIKHSLAVFAM